MNKRILFLAASFLGMILLGAARVDDDWLTALLAKLDAARIKYPQEKVHIHFDKPYYSVGDDVWLKAYVVNSENNELSAMSKVLYVDVIDEQDSVRKTLALPVINGLSSGDINLNEAVFSAGNYHIKAYTRWMQNFSTDYFFSKDLPVGDARKATGLTADAKFSFGPDKLNAEVTYLNLADKAPAAGKPVSFTLLHNGKEVSSGKAVTASNGKVFLEMDMKDVYKAGDLYLQTRLVVGDNNTIRRNFSVYDITQKPDLQFFPEGGRLVAGLRSKVGFKALLPDGRGGEVKGVVVDQDNKTITEFTSAHAGMGVFALQPVAGAVYTAVIKNQTTGLEYRYPLPAAEPQGYVLSVDHADADNLTVKVTAGKGMAPGKEMALVGLQNNVVRYTSRIKPDQQAVSTQVPKLKFATGIVQFTLLSGDAVPLAERLVFVNHQDQLKMDISTDKPVYKPREKVDMQLFLKDDDGSPVEGNISVAVTDENQVKIDEDEELSIYANLLLTSDLKGNIEAPNYYFNNTSAAKERQLDNLLLTQGWRRFNWAGVKNNTWPALTYQPQENIAISGRITTLTNKPVPYGKVALFATSMLGPLAIDTTADANGRFVIDRLDLPENLKFVVRAKNAKDRDNVKILLDKPEKPKYGPYLKPALMLNADMVNYLQTTQRRFAQMNYGLSPGTIALKEVNIQERRVPEKNVVKGSSKYGTGVANVVIKKEKIGTYQNLWFAFYGLPNIEVRGREIYSVGRVVSITRPKREPMLLRVDGVEFKPEMLQYLNPAGC